MHQLSIFTPLRKRRVLQEKPQPTSTAALQSVKVQDEQRRVLNAIIAAGERGLTADELEQQRDVPRGHQRIAELRKMHLIRQCGATRLTRAGRQAAVYVFNAIPSEAKEIA